MTRSVRVVVTHDLGAEEAKRRIERGFEDLRKAMASKIARADVAWSGQVASLRVGALGQNIDARVTVEDREVVIEAVLPWLLAGMAGAAQKFLAKTGSDALRLGHKPPTKSA